ncbi:hypothetical protein KEJ18_04660 [Candidatus Bathyarchaeota archaeon]|nr:hypothetical protein [Candidatus Bathyarchaeota archaeon]
MAKKNRLLRKELKLSERLFQLAQKRIEEYGFSSFNEFIRFLILRDLEVPNTVENTVKTRNKR